MFLLSRPRLGQVSCHMTHVTLSWVVIILAILIYYDLSDISKVFFETRIKVHPGKTLLQDILHAEVRGEHI